MLIFIDKMHIYRHIYIYMHFIGNIYMYKSVHMCTLFERKKKHGRIMQTYSPGPHPQHREKLIILLYVPMFITFTFITLNIFVILAVLSDCLCVYSPLLIC